MTYQTSLRDASAANRYAVIHEESVSDERERFSPSEHVQHKLQTMLVASLIPVSAMHTNRAVRRYASKA